MKKIIVLLIMCILFVNVVNADVNMFMQRTVSKDTNFQIQFSSNGIYAIELKIPEGFIIVNDVSEGKVGEDGFYRTLYNGDLVITMRTPSELGTYIFDGHYTEGNGVKVLSSIPVEVTNSILTFKQCPVCPPNTDYSVCENGVQTKVLYTCSESTDYICEKKLENRACITDSECANNVWVCIDKDRLGLQSSSCGFNRVIDCTYGCDLNENQCKEEPGRVGNAITGAVSGAQEGTGNLFNSIGQLIQNMVNWIKSLFSIG